LDDLVRSISIGDWINIIIASITFLTAIIALLTINEMRRQRIHSYFPDIHISNFSFHVYQAEEQDEFSSVYLHFFKDKQSEGSTISGYNELKTGISNIGFGVAKNVRPEWNFNFDHAERTLCNDKSVKWERTENTILIDFDPLDLKWAFDIDEEHLTSSYNFILPYSNETRETEITIPNYYINLYWLYMANQLNVNEVKYIEDHFPPLELNIKYTDIHSNEQQKKFTLSLEFVHFGLPTGKNEEIAQLKFIIKEK